METDMYSLKDLASLIAKSPDEVRVKEASRRIQHWASIGLLEAAGLETEQRHVGRGRVRRYPKVMAFWCALFAAMADRGFSALEVTRALAALNLHQAGVAKRGVDLVQAAMEGEGADVILILETKETPTGQFRRKLVRLPAEIPVWTGGVFLNLSEIFASAKE